MGTLSKLHARGRLGGHTRTNWNPLRKAMSRANHFETLECGHEQLVVSDFIGPTNAAKRRCRECGREARRKAGYCEPCALASYRQHGGLMAPEAMRCLGGGCTCPTCCPAD